MDRPRREVADEVEDDVGVGVELEDLLPGRRLEDRKIRRYVLRPLALQLAPDLLQLVHGLGRVRGHFGLDFDLPRRRRYPNLLVVRLF